VNYFVYRTNSNIPYDATAHGLFGNIEALYLLNLNSFNFAISDNLNDNLQ